jgi:hypothetical protein
MLVAAMWVQVEGQAPDLVAASAAIWTPTRAEVLV